MRRGEHIFVTGLSLSIGIDTDIGRDAVAPGERDAERRPARLAILSSDAPEWATAMLLTQPPAPVAICCG